MKLIILGCEDVAYSQGWEFMAREICTNKMIVTFAYLGSCAGQRGGGCLCSLLMDYSRAIAAGILRAPFCADNYRQSS